MRANNNTLFAAIAAFENHPAGKPPPGVVPNFEHPEDKSRIFIAVGSVLFSLMWLSVMNRFYVRWFINKKLVWGDASLIIAALLASVFFGGSCAGAIKGPMGKHQWEVTLGNLTKDTFLIGVNYFGSILASPARVFTQLTLFALHYEIFQPFRWMRIAIYIGATAMTIFFTASAVTQIALSTPRRGETWITHSMTKENHARMLIMTPVSVVGLGFDIYLLGLPLVAVYDLTMPVQRRVAVGVMFMMGILACLSSALSIYFRRQFVVTKDMTWAGQDVALTILVEMYIGVIVACMPALSRSLRYHFPQLLTSGSSRSSQSSASFVRSGDYFKYQSSDAHERRFQQRRHTAYEVEVPPLDMDYEKTRRNVSFELAHVRRVYASVDYGKIGWE